MKKFAFLAVLAGSLVINLHIIAQSVTPPPFPTRDGVVLSPVVKMSFGDFTLPLGSTGTIKLGVDNSRNEGGSVVLLNMGLPVNAAMFEFRLCPGRTIKIYYPTSVTINGTGSDNSQGRMDVTDLKFKLDGGTIDESGSGYITFTSNRGCNEIHRIYVGGTLNAGASVADNSGPYYNVDVLKLIIVQQ